MVKTKRIGQVTGVKVVLTAIVCVLVLGGAALAAEATSVTGKIVGMDQKKHTVTLESNQIGQPPANRIDIVLNDRTSVSGCDLLTIANETLYIANPWPVLKIGEKATVTFNDTGSVPVATTIKEQC